MAVFGRVVKVLIGGLDSGTLVDVSELDISFSVKSGKEIDTTAVLSVYNLEDFVVNKISNGGVVYINAGHETGNVSRELFKGGIVSIDPKENGADTLYTINCSGATNNKFKVVTRVYNQSTTALSIIKDLASSTGMPLELDSETSSKSGLSKKQYAGGYTVYGSSVKGIKTIAADCGLETIVDDLSIRIIDTQEGDLSRVLNLNFQTGLLEGLKPSKNSDNSGVTTYTCKCLLYPEIRRGRRLNIDDNNKSGTFKVESVEHKGSNYGDDFYSFMEVVQ